MPEKSDLRADETDSDQRIVHDPVNGDLGTVDESDMLGLLPGFPARFITFLLTATVAAGEILYCVVVQGNDRWGEH